MWNNLQKSAQFILRAFFPCRCLVCFKEGDILCKSHHKIPHNHNIYQAKGLKRVQARSYYQDAITKDLIHELKFKHRTEVAALMAKELLPLIDRDSVLIPIPLHWTRKLFRGFNQSELIIAELQKLDPHLKSIPANHFKRTKNTKQQALLAKKNRQKNLTKAFKWADKKLAPKNVILIDDIMTTGSTLSSAAQALKTAGSTQVEAVVFAHG